MTRFVITIVTLAIASLLWHGAALALFTHEGGKLQGLVGHPKPLDYAHSQYTRDGQRYEKWAFRAPAAILLTGILLISVAATFSMVNKRRLADLVILWGVAIISTAVVAAVMFYTYCIAMDAFI
ncbi:MAG TPA: hypothetical protein VNN08_09345 [Thermoanaerobaculia bacterium]|nr:hypothetical protein [Thermoanaerobaculia bacterium]